MKQNGNPAPAQEAAKSRGAGTGGWRRSAYVLGILENLGVTLLHKVRAHAHTTSTHKYTLRRPEIRMPHPLKMVKTPHKLPTVVENPKGSRPYPELVFYINFIYY
jgi:hypothetical protein